MFAAIVLLAACVILLAETTISHTLIAVLAILAIVVAWISTGPGYPLRRP